MKKNLWISLSFLLTALMIIMIGSKSYSQTGKSDVLLSFQRQANGKVVQMNAANQKVFNFSIKGLAAQADVDNFSSKFTKKDLVVSIKISDLSADGQRKGCIIMDQTAKLPKFQELLKNAGVNTVSIDGELKSVDDLGKDKKTQVGNKAK